MASNYPMTDKATVVLGSYRARGYDADDRALLQEVFGALGPTRLTPLDLPEAGGVAELSVVIEYVGLLAAGAIGELIVQRYYQRLEDGLRRLFAHKEAKGGPTPELSIAFSFDDLDIVMTPVDVEDIPRLRELAIRVHAHLSQAPLSGQAITRIVAGMMLDGDRWQEPNVWERPDVERRYWGISTEGHRALTHVYDSVTGAFTLLPERTTEWIDTDVK